MSTKETPHKDRKPKSVSDAVWTSVVNAWRDGMSDREAALIATEETGEFVKASDIASWKKSNPEVAELQAFLEVSLRTKAKRNIKKDIEAGRSKTSMWYLERKASDEFSTKSAVAFEGAIVELSLEDKEKALKKMVEDFENGE